MTRAKDHGINLNDPSRNIKMDRKDGQAVDELMQKLRKNCVEFVLFITTEKRDPVHGKVSPKLARG